MPLFSFKCKSCEKVFEDILSHWEEDELVQKFGKVVLPCPECENGEAEKESGIELTGNMAQTWKEEMWGKATK